MSSALRWALAVLLLACTRSPAAGQSLEPPDCGARGIVRARQDTGTAAAAAVTFQAMDDIPLPGGATRFDYQSLDQTTGRLYVAHMGDGSVVAVDTRAQRVIGVVNGLPRVTGVWVVPELHRLYASATGLHQVAIIDTRTFSLIRRVGPIGFPDGIAYAPAARKLFVSDESGAGELVIDAARDRVIGSIALGGEAGNTIYDAGSGCILVAVQTRNEVVAIDPATDRVTGRYPIAGAARPHGLSVDAARRLLFVANEDNATLQIVDLRTMKVIGRQTVGREPDVLAFDPEWRRLYVGAESGSVTVLEERGDTLVRVGFLRLPEAHSVSVDPTTHFVYLPLAHRGGRPLLRVLRPSPPRAQ